MSIGLALALILAAITIGILHYQIERDYKKRIAALAPPEVDDDFAFYIGQKTEVAQRILKETLKVLKEYGCQEKIITVNEAWGKKYVLYNDISIALIYPTEDAETQVIRRARITFIDDSLPLDWIVQIAGANHWEHKIHLFSEIEEENEDGEN